MFGAAGFDARRDIAGIVLNRWGHAYFAPAPGFFFGSEDQPAPHEVIRKPHGRIVFAHSELQGNMNMAHAMLEGKRGALAGHGDVMKRDRMNLMTTLCCAVLLTGASIPSFAAEEALGEILVTAQRRSERLQDVPAAITALSGDSLNASASAG